MNIYPIQNVIDSVYRSSNDFRFNVSINIENSIFRSLLANNQYFNPVVAGDSVEQMNYLHNTINVNAHISSDYLNHFQNKPLFNTYHIKDFLFFLNPPIKLLKREDIILIKNRLESTKRVFVSTKIADIWSNIEGSVIEPGIYPLELNKEKRKSVVILSNNDKSISKIYQVLQNAVGEVSVVSNTDDYHSIMDILNQHRVCINMGPCIDNLFPLAAGCRVVSKFAMDNNTYEYDSLNDLEKVVLDYNNTYDIKKQIDISSEIFNKYKYEDFEINVAKYITSNIMEPFLI